MKFACSLVVGFISIVAAGRCLGDEPAKPPEIGKPAPDFKVMPVGGDRKEPLTLADFKGQTLILEFWATWCGPCRDARERLIDLHKEFAGKGIRILSVSDEAPNAIQKFLKANPVPYQIATDITYGAQTTYGVIGIPACFLIDKDGKLVWQGGILYKKDMQSYLEDGIVPRMYRAESQPARLEAVEVLRIDIGRSRDKPEHPYPISAGIGGDHFSTKMLSIPVGDAVTFLLDISKLRMIADDSVPEDLWDVRFMHRPANGGKPDKQLAIDALCREAGVRLEPIVEERDVWIATHSGKEPPPAKGVGNDYDFEAKTVTYRWISLAELFRIMENLAGLPIVDETGLKGNYRLTLPSFQKMSFEDLRKAFERDYGIKFEKGRRRIQLYRLTAALVSTRPTE